MASRPAATTWHRAPEVIGRRLPDGWLLLGSTMTVPAHLTSTATDLWDHLDTARTDEQILVALRDRYAGDAGEIARDLAQAMGELEALGLVRRES